MRLYFQWVGVWAHSVALHGLCMSSCSQFPSSIITGEKDDRLTENRIFRKGSVWFPGEVCTQDLWLLASLNHWYGRNTSFLFKGTKSLSSFQSLLPSFLPLPFPLLLSPPSSFPPSPLLLPSCSSPPSPSPPSTPGDYFFSIEMTKMTAACTVEFWISTDHDPTGTRRLLILEYPEMVRTRMFVSLAAEIMTQGYPRGGEKTEFNFDLWDWFMDAVSLPPPPHFSFFSPFSSPFSSSLLPLPSPPPFSPFHLSHFPLPSLPSGPK